MPDSFSNPPDSSRGPAVDATPPRDVDELFERYRRGERDFRQVNLQGQYLGGIELPAANLAGADLSGADLTKAQLREANLQGANLAGAVLVGASLREANLRGASLRGANLFKANLIGADIRDADFSQASLDEAKLLETQRNEATNFSGADLSIVMEDPDASGESPPRPPFWNKAVGFASELKWWYCFVYVFWAVVAIGQMIGALLGSVAGGLFLDGARAEGLAFFVAKAASLVVGGVFAWKLTRARFFPTSTPPPPTQPPGVAAPGDSSPRD